MRPNRFFTDLDTMSYVHWLVEKSQTYCSEAYIIQRIEKCEGRQEMRVYSYERSCSLSMDLLRSLYLRGDSIESLRPVYLQARERLRLLEESIHACGMEKAKMDIINPIKVGMLLSVGHALGESRDEIGRNTRAMSAGYDLFIDRLLSIYDPTRPLADDINHKPVYKSLYAVFDAAPEKRPGMIARYLDQWEKLLLSNKIPGEPYPVTEKLQQYWTGFWCYPAAAVVAALNIDDSSFIDHEFYPTDLMQACAQYRGEPVILEPLQEPALPEPPKRSPKRKPAPELLAPWLPLFERMAATLPKSLQASLWNALVEWLNEEWEEEQFDVADLLCALSTAQWEMELLQTYRRLVLLHVDWKDDESALSFCEAIARTLGIEDAFSPDPVTLNRPERVWEVLYTFHQWLAPHGYRLVTPLTGEDAYYALAVKTKDADTLITALEQTGLKVKTFVDDQPF
jgi:hypothetical protein